MNRHTRFGNAFDDIASGSTHSPPPLPSPEQQIESVKLQDHQPRLRKRHPHGEKQGTPSAPSSATNDRAQGIVTNPTSPWEKYDRLYKVLDIAGEPFFGVSLITPNIRVLIRKIPGSHNPGVKERTLFHSQQKRHRNIMSIYEAFDTENSLHLVFEETVPLCRIIRCSFFPTEEQLTAILGQILDGLIYLRQEGGEAENFNSQGITLTLQGVVKLFGSWGRERGPEGSIEEMKQLQELTAKLMYKSITKGSGGSARWKHCNEAVSFCSTIKPNAQPETLLKHPLFALQSQRGWLTNKVAGLVARTNALVSARFEVDPREMRPPTP